MHGNQNLDSHIKVIQLSTVLSRKLRVFSQIWPEFGSEYPWTQTLVCLVSVNILYRTPAWISVRVHSTICVCLGYFSYQNAEMGCYLASAIGAKINRYITQLMMQVYLGTEQQCETVWGVEAIRLKHGKKPSYLKWRHHSSHILDNGLLLYSFQRFFKLLQKKHIAYYIKNTLPFKLCSQKAREH